VSDTQRRVRFFTESRAVATNCSDISQFSQKFHDPFVKSMLLFLNYLPSVPSYDGTLLSVKVTPKMTQVALIYVSKMVTPLTPDDLREMLEVSRHHNAHNHVSGMLLHRAGYFIQVLEGDEAAVVLTYRRIAQDSRHEDCQLVLKRKIKARAFPDSAMGFYDLDTPAQLPPALMEFMGHPFDPADFVLKTHGAERLFESLHPGHPFH